MGNRNKLAARFRLRANSPSGDTAAAAAAANVADALAADAGQSAVVGSGAGGGGGECSDACDDDESANCAPVLNSAPAAAATEAASTIASSATAAAAACVARPSPAADCANFDELTIEQIEMLDERIAGQQSQLDAYDARDKPSRLSHGFWMQQSSWLHSYTSYGGGSSAEFIKRQRAAKAAAALSLSSSSPATQMSIPILTTTPPPPPPPATQMQLSAVGEEAAAPEPKARRRNKRMRLARRWANIMRSAFGGGGGGGSGGRRKSSSRLRRASSSTRSRRSQLHQDTLAVPAARKPRKQRRRETAAESATSASDNNNNKSKRSWLLRSLSSSTSALLAPLVHNTSANVVAPSRTCQSSCGVNARRVTDETTTTQLSPYKQLVRAFGKHARSSPKKPARARPSDADASVGGSSSSLLGALLASPLFKRRAKRRDNALTTDDNDDDDDDGHIATHQQQRAPLQPRRELAGKKIRVAHAGGQAAAAAATTTTTLAKLAPAANQMLVKADDAASLGCARANEPQTYANERERGEIEIIMSATRVQPEQLDVDSDDDDDDGGDEMPAEQHKEDPTNAAHSLLPLIQPLGSSTSSFASSTMFVDSANASQLFGGGGGDGGDQDDAFNTTTSVSRAVKIALDEHHNSELNGSASALVPTSSIGRKPMQQQQQPHEPFERPASQPVGVVGGNDQQQTRGAGATVGGAIKNNFKKLVKRQQSVDSYRMSRELKNKARRQQEARNKHQSNEAIRSVVNPSGGAIALDAETLAAVDAAAAKRKYSMRNEELHVDVEPLAASSAAAALRIRVDTCASDSPSKDATPAVDEQRVSATPPNTLSLQTTTTAAAGHPGAFVVGSFSGCITPTYPTHHLPSPKYVSPNVKKYSNASTISSSIGGDYMSSGSFLPSAATSATSTPSNATQVTQQQRSNNLHEHQPQVAPSATAAAAAVDMSLVMHDEGLCESRASAMSQSPSLLGAVAVMTPEAVDGAHAPPFELDPVAAAKRAQLAEHIYDNKCGLGEDMKFLASLPELCDITFLVGETREPVCAVKSVLAARSRVFHKILFGNRRALVAAANSAPKEHTELVGSRRSSSPRAPQLHRVLAGKTSSPIGGNARSTSPSNQWSVVASDGSLIPVSSPLSNGGGDAADSAATDAPGNARSGRVSVASNGRESISQTSMGSQTPLVIGPGQTAAPAPKSKQRRGLIRDAGGSRLSRMFLKRASDPSLKQQQQLLPPIHNHTTTHNNSQSQQQQCYLDKMSSSQMSTTMIIEEFEPDVFRQLIEYIHTGCVLLQARTLLGLLNAADYYGLEQLRKACLRFVSCCITVDTVCSLLSTAERYIQYKCTKSIVQKVLEFVDTHANEIFKLNAFGLLPEHVVRLILARDGLQADEFVKYNGVYTWCEHYCRSFELTNIADVMRNFLDFIQFHKIPTNVLLSEIYPMHIVPDNLFLSALAHQADPKNLESQPSRARRMTLPNPSYVYDSEQHDDDGDGDGDKDESPRECGETGAHSNMQSDDMRRRSDARGAARDQTHTGALHKQVAPTHSSSKHHEKCESPAAKARRKSSLGGVIGNTFGRHHKRVQTKVSSDNIIVSEAARARKHGSMSQRASPEVATTIAAAAAEAKARKLRKGSIAQVSMSGVMRLSHRLSMKKKPSSGALSGISAAATAAPIDDDDESDPMCVGQRILDAYLAEQRERELELERRKQQEAQERQLANAEAKQAHQQQKLQHQRRPVPVIKTGSQDVSLASMDMGASSDLSRTPAAGLQSQQQQQQQQQQQSAASKVSSRRKSFRDFKHISKRIFMRHSSSRLLQTLGGSSSISSANEPMLEASVNAPLHEEAQQQPSAESKAVAAQDRVRDKRRLLRIKRSETVFESSYD